MVEPYLSVTVRRHVAAPAEQVWAALTDLTAMARRSPETIQISWRGEPGLRPGAEFVGRNRLGRLLSWTTVCTVLDVVPGRRFSFRTSPPSRSTWTYTVDPQPDGCLVTESMSKQEPQPWPVRALQRMAGVTDRAEHLRAGMERTLAVLAADMETGAAEPIA